MTQSPTAADLARADSQRVSAALQIPLADARREVQLLLTRSLDISLAALVAHPDQAVEGSALSTYRAMLARRLQGEPIAYVFGEREFYGRLFEIGPDVLIPRPETELLVDLALERLAMQAEGRVLDLGTGSGCIAITVARERRQLRVIATDISKAALAVAARNAGRHATYNVELRAGTGYEPVAGERFSMIVSNPPYIANGDPHLAEGDLRYEPAGALEGGDDGLDVLRTVIGQAPLHLRPGGWLVVEHGHDQAEAVRGLMLAAGLENLSWHADLAGVPRACVGRLLEASP